MTLSISTRDHGRIDVFSIDLPPQEAGRFAKDADRVAAALGARPDPAQVDIFDTALMGDLGLDGYLVQGIGVADRDIADHAQALGDIDQALVLRAAAFGGQAVTVTPAAPLRHIVTLYEATARVDLTPLRTESAAGASAPHEAAPKETAHRSRWLSIGLLLAVILLLAAVIPILVSL